MAHDDQKQQSVTRRDFIKSASVTAGAVAATQFSLPGAWAAGSDEIRIGLIGAGGRGTGAVQDALKARQGRAPRGDGRGLPGSPEEQPRAV